jgi:hypothetical protein
MLVPTEKDFRIIGFHHPYVFISSQDFDHYIVTCTNNIILHFLYNFKEKKFEHKKAFVHIRDIKKIMKFYDFYYYKYDVAKPHKTHETKLLEWLKETDELFKKRIESCLK